MAPTVESENTTNTVIGSPVTLAAPTTSAIRVIRLDLNALAPGEVGHLRVQTKVRSAGTIRDQYYLSYTGPVGNQNIELPPITSDLGATVTFTQANGSVRAIDWKILTIGSAPVVESENTTALTVGTPATLAAPTTNKTRVLRLDLNPLLPITGSQPEILRIQVQTKIRSAGTLRDHFNPSYPGGSLCSPILETVPIAGDLGATFIITQFGGTGRSIDWKILTLD